jgi:hypothetical protein
MPAFSPGTLRAPRKFATEKNYEKNFPANTITDASASDWTKCEALGLSGTALDFAMSHRIVATEPQQVEGASLAPAGEA